MKGKQQISSLEEDIGSIFSPKTTQFFDQIGENNNGQWFRLHRDDYLEYAKKPLEIVASYITEILNFVSAGSKGRGFTPKISRINRPARFGPRGGPYRDYMWAQFMDWTVPSKGSPSFRCDIGPGAFSMQVCVLHPDRSSLDRFRCNLADYGSLFLAYVDAQPFRRVFEVSGTSYKKPLASDIRAELLPWYQYKSLSFRGWVRPETGLYSADFLSKVREMCLDLFPIYLFMVSEDLLNELGTCTGRLPLWTKRLVVAHGVEKE